MSTQILHGKDLRVYRNNEAIALAKSCEIIKQTEMKETCSSASGAYKEYIPGRSSWRVSVGFLVSNTDELFYSEGVAVTLKLNDTTLGIAYTTEGRLTATIGNLAQGAVSFQGTGPLNEQAAQQ